MKKGFCIFSLLILLLTPFSISAEEKPQFIFGQPLDPYSVPMLLDASTIIEFDNSNMCSDWATLSAAQQNTVLSNIGLNDFNFSVLTTDDILYLGKAIWCSSYEDGVYRLHSQSNVDDPGFYIVNIDGTLTKNGEIQSLSFKSIFYSLYDVGSIWFDYYDIKSSNCDVPNIPIVPPSLNLPDVNIPSSTVNSEQSQIISLNGSPGIRGGQIYCFMADYYNIYSVVQTAETDEFFSNRNNNFYYYQLKDGKYIFPVYQYSEISVFAPNMNVSGSFIPISVKYNELFPDYSFVILSDDSNVIQRDVNTFSTKYIDALTRDVYSIDKLPFSNDENNENHLEYLGVSTQHAFNRFPGSSVSIELSFENGITTTLYFVVTDRFDTYQTSLNLINQVTIDNSLQHGNSTSQAAQNSNNQMNNNLNNTLDNFENIENQYNQNISDNLNQIDLNFNSNNFGSNFLTSAEWFTTQFNNIVLDTPFNGLIIFSCVVGLGLLLLGRFL